MTTTDDYIRRRVGDKAPRSKLRACRKPFPGDDSDEQR